MQIYEEIGLRPFINATGSMYTRYGGTLMPDPVVAAMAEASKHFVNIFDLQDRMGQAIATMTHNEVAFISCGAASGMLLAVAACIAGTNPEIADRLPDTHDLPNQIIMRNSERGTEIDPVLRAAGGKIIRVGPPDRPASAHELLAAINDQTAAIVIIVFDTPEKQEVKAIVNGAHAPNIPVLIDGATAVPPKENLWHYTRDLGADAFITSGGKGLRGPQSTGLVLGSQSIIDGCKFHASPNLRLGRGMKVGKEEFAGLYTALKLFLAQDEKHEKNQTALHAQQITHIAEHLKDLPNLKISPQNSQLIIEFPKLPPTTAEALAKKMLASNPSILLSGRNHRLTIHSTQLQPGEAQIVAQQLRQTLHALMTQNTS